MAGHGGGAWKVAYADFVTAMMAFFMVMWITAQSKQLKMAVAHYFNDPFNSLLEDQRSRGRGLDDLWPAGAGLEDDNGLAQARRSGRPQAPQEMPPSPRDAKSRRPAPSSGPARGTARACWGLDLDGLRDLSYLHRAIDLHGGGRVKVYPLIFARLEALFLGRTS